VFLLWGRNAQEHAKGISASRHHVLKAVHPSGLSANKVRTKACMHARTWSECAVVHAVCGCWWRVGCGSDLSCSWGVECVPRGHTDVTGECAVAPRPLQLGRRPQGITGKLWGSWGIRADVPDAVWTAPARTRAAGLFWLQALFEDEPAAAGVGAARD
jgi:hypothetical protein